MRVSVLSSVTCSIPAVQSKISHKTGAIVAGCKPSVVTVRIMHPATLILNLMVNMIKISWQIYRE